MIRFTYLHNLEDLNDFDTFSIRIDIVSQKKKEKKIKYIDKILEYS